MAVMPVSCDSDQSAAAAAVVIATNRTRSTVDSEFELVFSGFNESIALPCIQSKSIISDFHAECSTFERNLCYEVLSAMAWSWTVGL